MRRRLTGAILLLYPRRVRERHGPEIVALIEDLIAHEGRSRTGLFIRLAVDGLVQRIASTATVWTVAAVLVATSFGASGGLGLCCRPCAPGCAANGAHGRAGMAHAPDPAPPTPIASHFTLVGWDDRATHFGAIPTAVVTPLSSGCEHPAAGDYTPA